MRPNKELYRETFEAHGLICHILEMPTGTHMNGYVEIPSNSSIMEMSNYTIQQTFTAHGGITWTHELPILGKKVRVLGFATTHAGDYWPDLGDNKFTSLFGKTQLWTIDKLKQEVEQLAKQMADYLKVPETKNSHKQRMLNILKENNIEIHIGGCGCCSSPWVTFIYEGEKIINCAEDFQLDEEDYTEKG